MAVLQYGVGDSNSLLEFVSLELTHILVYVCVLVLVSSVSDFRWCFLLLSIRILPCLELTISIAMQCSTHTNNNNYCN